MFLYGPSVARYGSWMHCRHTLFTSRCSPRAREFLRSANFSLWRTVAELRGVKVVQFSDFGLFSYTKPLKRTFRWPAYSPRVTAENDYDFSRESRRFKRVSSGTGDFLRLLIGELGTPKVSQIFAYGKWLYPYIMLLHGASDLDQRCLKTRSSEDERTFPPSIFASTPKITPKPRFWGTFQCDTYYTERPPSVAR